MDLSVYIILIWAFLSVKQNLICTNNTNRSTTFLGHVKEQCMNLMESKSVFESGRIEKYCKVTVSNPVKLRNSGLTQLKDQIHETTDHKIAGIFGGIGITIEKANYIAALIDEDNALVGSGVLLNNQWLLSAAFNFYGLSEEEIKIRVGSSLANSTGELCSISRIVIHPKYTERDWNYDVALAKLKTPVKFSKTVGNAKISFSKLPKNGTTAKVIGFGWTRTTYGGYLQEAEVPILSYDSCKDHYTDSITSLSFCTAKNGIGPCVFDFGNPLIHRNKIIGIFSGTTECGSVDYPAVYADVAKYRKWIEKTIRKYSGSVDHLLVNEINNK